MTRLLLPLLGPLLIISLPSPASAQAASGSLDQALGVVLRSGCAQGVEALAALAERDELAAEERTLARRIAGLCQTVLADRARSGEAVPDGDIDRAGRGKLVFGGTIYGIWTGIALDIIADIDDGRAMVIPPLIGGGAGLGLALLGTRAGPISNGQAWATITGFDYGTYSGLLWGAAADSSDEKVVVGSALGTGLAGGLAAILLSRQQRPLQGDVELVRSGGLWGFATGGLLAAIVQPQESRTTFTMMGLGMDGGLAAGLALAQVFDPSRNRMLFIDTGALGGGLLGFAAAFLALGPPDGDREGRILAGAALAGLYAGMGAAIYLTRNMTAEGADARAAYPALVARDPGGRWGFGRLTLLPVVTAVGNRPRLTGALTPLLGGAW